MCQKDCVLLTKCVHQWLWWKIRQWGSMQFASRFSQGRGLHNTSWWTIDHSIHQRNANNHDSTDLQGRPESNPLLLWRNQFACWCYGPNQEHFSFMRLPKNVIKRPSFVQRARKRGIGPINSETGIFGRIVSWYVYQQTFPFCPAFDDDEDVLMYTYERPFAEDIPLHHPQRYFSMPCAQVKPAEGNKYTSKDLSGSYSNTCP